VTNFDFDDQALNYLGFGTDIYYMLGHLGWVQFSNGVSTNTHKEFALEILALLSIKCQAANRPLIPYDQPMVLRGNIGIGRYWFRVLPLYVGHLLKAGDYKESRTSLMWDSLGFEY
jgi:hypothetical protein